MFRHRLLGRALCTSLNLSRFQQKMKGKSSWVHLFLASTLKSTLQNTSGFRTSPL